MNWEIIHGTLVLVIATTMFTGGKSKNDFVMNSFVKSIIPLEYKVKLIPYIAIDDSKKTKTVNEQLQISCFGESGMMFSILESTSYIRFDNENLEIYNFEKLISSNTMLYETEKYKYNFATYILEFHYSTPLPPGIYTFKLEFFGRSTVDNTMPGFIISSHVNKNGENAWVVASDIQATGTRKLFPCLDQPQFKSTFTISIKHHRNFTALSNMPRNRSDKYARSYEEFIWSIFFTTPLMSTYHIGIVVTNYSPIYIDVHTTIWHKERSEQLLEFARQTLLSAQLSMELEFKNIRIRKFEHIIIPSIPQNDLSKWGLMFYREEDFLLDEQSDSFVRKIEIARRLASKVAYQWFGSAVSPPWWSFLWLHNGLATLYGEEAVTKLFKDPRIKDFFIIRDQFETLRLDYYYDMNPPQINSLSDIHALFDITNNIKVPIIFRMLQNVITENVFRNATKTYVYNYRFQSVIPSEFWSVQNKEARNSSYPCSIEKDFPAWLVQRNYPIVSFKRDPPSWDTLELSFNQSKSISLEWCIFTKYMIKSRTEKSVPLWLTSNNPYFDAHLVYVEYEHLWIMVDIQEAAYYRIDYEPENWRKIAQFLNSTHYKEISTINRAKAIDDAYHLSIARHLDISLFWELTHYLSQETEYAAWYPMFRILEQLSTLFPFRHHPITIYVKEKLRVLLNNPVNKLIFHSSNDGFLKSLRYEILKWACLIDHDRCLLQAKRQLLSYLEDHVTKKILPPWKKWTYCNGLKTADKNMWNNVMTVLLKKHNHEFLPFLTCIKDMYIIRNVIPGIFKNLSIPQDTGMTRTLNYIFYSIIGYHDYYYVVDILPLFGNKNSLQEINLRVALVHIINHLYSTEQLGETLQYMQGMKHKFVEELMLYIKFKIQTRTNQLKEQLEYFRFILPSR